MKTFNIEIKTAYGQAIVRFETKEARKMYRDALIFNLLQNEMSISLEAEEGVERKRIIQVRRNQSHDLVARIAPTYHDVIDSSLLDFTNDNAMQVAAWVFA